MDEQRLGERFYVRINQVLVSMLVVAILFVIPLTAQSSPKGKYKILHIMSYHADWAWNKDQFRGFQDALRGLDVEYRVFEMDTKRKSSKEWIQKVSQEAKVLIDTWKPDLVYTNDDDAQQYIVKDYVNTDIPFVFSGINAMPEKYGFVGSKNVTGVLEQEHFVQTVRLLKEIVPSIEKIAVIVDESPMWESVVERMKQKQAQIPGVKFIDWNIIHTFKAICTWWEIRFTTFFTFCTHKFSFLKIVCKLIHLGIRCEVDFSKVFEWHIFTSSGCLQKCTDLFHQRCA